jgi:16S rRNA (guanine527-N7)-methyltransferase
MPRVPMKSIWRVFAKKYNLSDYQVAQFERYMQELKEWNDKIDLTTITTDQSIIELHFDDSMQISNFIDISQKTACADIGSGGGFPGIPLHILYPKTPFYLIEVKRKRIEFLEHLIDVLKLENVMVFTVDWRTFLRKTEFAIDLFCARASLEMNELVRMFKPSCIYNDSSLAYWASRCWEPDAKVEPLIKEDWEYHVGGRKRRIILMKK